VILEHGTQVTWLGFLRDPQHGSVILSHVTQVTRLSYQVLSSSCLIFKPIFDVQDRSFGAGHKWIDVTRTQRRGEVGREEKRVKYSSTKGGRRKRLERSLASSSHVTGACEQQGIGRAGLLG
jgi:hypothetical protein